MEDDEVVAVQRPGNHAVMEDEEVDTLLQTALFASSTSPSSTGDKTEVHEPEIELRFKPKPGVDYAKAFSRAVQSAYEFGSLTGGSDIAYAARVLDGEGRDLIFSDRYLQYHIPENGTWNGLDPRTRRAAFSHILGVDAGACTAHDCLHSSSCSHCSAGRGHFQGCRHYHDLSVKQACSNCSASGNPMKCSGHVTHHRIDGALFTIERGSRRMLISSINRAASGRPSFWKRPDQAEEITLRH